MVVATSIVVGFSAWAVLFVPDRRGFWSRAVTVGVLLSLGSLAVIAGTDAVGRVLTARLPTRVALGGGVGLGLYLLARLAYPLACRHLTGLADRADELFELRGLAPRTQMTVAIVVMGTGEELLFRGLLQSRAGLVVALIVYAAVQLVARNVVLFLLGVLGGLVWGLVFTASGSLVAATLAHVIPVAAIALRPPAAVREGTRPRTPSGT